MREEKASVKNWKVAWKNPFVIGWILLLTIVLSVNVLMISLAVTTFPGLTVENFYEKGKDMGKVIAQRKKMDEMGWKVDVDLSKVVQNKPQNYIVTIRNKEGILLSVDSAVLYYYRPSNKDYDGESKLNYSGSAGIYSGEILLPLRGKYDFVLELKLGKKLFQIGRSIMVQPDSF